jgi:hypothetical protein
MKKLSAAILSLGLPTLLAGCGNLVEIDGVRMRCGNRDVTVVNAAGHLQVTRERIEVCRGYSVNLILRNPVAAGTARTRQMGAGADWLDVDNRDPRTIVITPPAATAPGEYKYSLEVDGIGLLDPRIVVQ